MGGKVDKIKIKWKEDVDLNANESIILEKSNIRMRYREIIQNMANG